MSPRRAFLAVAAVSAVGTALELAALRHWDGVEQLIPWAVLTVVAAGIVVAVAGPTRDRVARVLAAIGLVGGLYGVITHISSNYDAAPLDYKYTDRWPTMSFVSKVWHAASGAVGPAAVLAPGALSLCGLCLLLATTVRDPSTV